MSSKVTKRLQDEIKKKRPFDSLAQEAYLNLLRTGDMLEGRLGRLFRDYGITSSQYNVLRILRGEGTALPCLEIARRLIQVVPAITGLLDRLEEQGLVTRQRSVGDRRVVYIELTDKAQTLLERLDKPVLDLHQTLLGHMTEQELRTLSQLVEKARAGCLATDSDDAE